MTPVTTATDPPTVVRDGTRTLVFAGTAVLTERRRDGHRSYARPVAVELLLDADGAVTVTSVCVAPFRMGSVTCQISQVPRTGAGTYVDGDLRVTLWLRLSMDVLGDSQGCDLCVTLAADWVEPPTRGPVTVLGAVTCRRGHLAGRSALLVLSGTISPAEVRRGDRP